MNLIIHDLDPKYNEDILKKFNLKKEETRIISDNKNITPCMGCFGCWIKTPGECILKDGYNNMGAILGDTRNIIIISETFYGTYSPFVKNVLDRSISYVHPYFTKRDGEIHHQRRYANNTYVKVYLYGNATEEEKNTAKKLVIANLINFYASLEKIDFFNNKEEILYENSIY